jgi:hypothetical protein
LIKKFNFFSPVNYFKFLIIKTDPDWIRISIQRKMLDPDPDQMNADPQPWTLDPTDPGSATLLVGCRLEMAPQPHP